MDFKGLEMISCKNTAGAVKTAELIKNKLQIEIYILTAIAFAAGLTRRRRDGTPRIISKVVVTPGSVDVRGNYITNVVHILGSKNSFCLTIKTRCHSDPSDSQARFNLVWQSQKAALLNAHHTLYITSCTLLGTARWFMEKSEFLVLNVWSPPLLHPNIKTKALIKRSMKPCKTGRGLL